MPVAARSITPVDYVWPASDTWGLTVELVQANGEPVTNLAGATALWRIATASGEVLFDVECDVDDVLATVAGEVARGDTDLAAQRLVYVVRVLYADDTAVTIQRGRIEVVRTPLAGVL
jgi:hypothetical protein